MSEYALAVATFVLGFALGMLWQMRQTDEVLAIAQRAIDLHENLEAAIRDVNTRFFEFHMELAERDNE